MKVIDIGTKDMLGRTRIIPLSDALQLLRENMPKVVSDEEKLALDKAYGRITSRAICAPENLPAYLRSTMDGYAVRAKDTFGATEHMPAYLEISGNVLMGELPEKGPLPGSCYSIATGGLLPPETDSVVMLEHTVNIDGQMVEIVKPAAVGGNIIDVGEDISENDLICPAGSRLRPHVLGLLAGLGVCSLFVYREVRVGIISTGDEIVDFCESPRPGQIRDMNSVHLAALVTGAGGKFTRYPISPDDEETFRNSLELALSENDVVLFSGGSSVGSRDLGVRVIETLGSPGVIFHGVAIKPGKPVIYAKVDGKPLFGLPGHPVSAAVSFNLFVRPVLEAIAGNAGSQFPATRSITARLMRNINSASGRTDFVRTLLKRNTEDMAYEAKPVLGKSGALSTMVKADGYLIIAEKKQGLKEGEMVEVFLYE